MLNAALSRLPGAYSMYLVCVWKMRVVLYSVSLIVIHLVTLMKNCSM